MLWTADSIQDFTKADRQKSPSEGLIVSWPVDRVTFLKRSSSVIFKVFPNHDVFTLFSRNHFLCFFASFFFFFK